MEADYVIVGAGSAGCVLANRLSADGRNSVILLEAGGSGRDPRLRVPAALIYTVGNPRFDWCFKTEPDATRGGRVEGWPRGRGLGGTSAINGLLYLRGHRLDFDSWAQQGNAGWGYDDLLPYFRRSENNGSLRSAYHGIDGPLAVSDMPSRHPLAAVFAEAAAEAGIPRNEDLNGAELEGVGFPQGTMRNGERVSAADAYLKPARGRANLQIMTDVFVRRVLFTEGKASGVECERGGRVETIGAGREVILAAGTLASPHLLMHSGIGDAAALAAQGIAVRADLQGVGRNLVDHPAVACGRFVTVRTNNMETSLPRRALHGARWLLTRQGPAANMLAHAMAFVRSEPGLEAPDLQLYFTPQGTSMRDGQVRFMDRPAVAALASVCRPDSRGDLRLVSGDPRHPLAIHPNMLGARRDVDRLVCGLKLLRRIFAASAFAPFVLDEYLPGADCGSDAELEANVRTQTRPCYHPVGTCRMGSDPTAVVDAQLRVHGVGGLRVADASIMPSQVSANPNAAIYAIGEKAADLVLAAR